MTELIQHLNLLDEVFQGLSSHVPLSKLFYSDFGAHPPSFKDISIATSTYQIRSWINLKLLIIDEEVETVLTKSNKQS